MLYQMLIKRYADENNWDLLAQRDYLAEFLQEVFPDATAAFTHFLHCKANPDYAKATPEELDGDCFSPVVDPWNGPDHRKP